MNNATLLHELTDPANRHDPYPIYARFRESPVTRQDDGAYVVSTYREINALLHDPRVSSDQHNLATPPDGLPPPELAPFILRDPPDHDRLRRVAMRQFGPPNNATRVAEREPEISGLVDRLVDGFGERRQIDIVDDFAYPLPVQVICRLLGVPSDDEPQFHGWAEAIVAGIDAADQENAEELTRERNDARAAIFGYLGDLIARQRDEPGDSLFSRLANDTSDDRMSDDELKVTGILLLVAGHETTVNLIANGTLTLLRNPELLPRLRDDRELAVPLVEELLRYEPPVQYLPNRIALADIDIAGTTITKGSRIILLIASGSRDPERFVEPERFDPDRRDNQHFGFGGGIHYCFGAPLARLEAQLALLAFARRLRNPRVAEDPPPYRPSPVLRGPRHLLVAVDGVEPAK